MECGCLHGGVIENGRTRNPLTAWTVPELVLYVQVWLHIPGDSQNTTPTTTTKMCSIVKSRSDQATQSNGLPQDWFMCSPMHWDAYPRLTVGLPVVALRPKDRIQLQGGGLICTQ